MNLLLNKKFELPADGWFQVVPVGTFEHSSGIRQLIDKTACEAIVNRFLQDAQAPSFGGILVDYDHFSLDTEKPSEAAGWIINLLNRDDGVYAQIRWAGDGEAKVVSGAYRYVSPVFNRDDCETVGTALRPLRLCTVALTNDPNMKCIKPLSNRSSEPVPAEPETKPGVSGGNKESTMDYKAELLALLGLPPEATDEQITAARECRKGEMENACKERDAMKNRAEAAEGKLAGIEAKALENQVEADLVKYADRIANREQWKKSLMANRADALACLEAITPPAQKVLNRKGTPQQAVAVANRAKEQDLTVRAIMNREKCSFETAWDKARAEKPELFKEETQG